MTFAYLLFLVHVWVIEKKNMSDMSKNCLWCYQDFLYSQIHQVKSQNRCSCSCCSSSRCRVPSWELWEKIHKIHLQRAEKIGLGIQMSMNIFVCVRALIFQTAFMIAFYVFHVILKEVQIQFLVLKIRT